ASALATEREGKVDARGPLDPSRAGEPAQCDNGRTVSNDNAGALKIVDQLLVPPRDREEVEVGCRDASAFAPLERIHAEREGVLAGSVEDRDVPQHHVRHSAPEGRPRGNALLCDADPCRYLHCHGESIPNGCASNVESLPTAAVRG